jgi:hypothetical protein
MTHSATRTNLWWLRLEPRPEDYAAFHEETMRHVRAAVTEDGALIHAAQQYAMEGRYVVLAAHTSPPLAPFIRRALESWDDVQMTLEVKPFEAAAPPRPAAPELNAGG